MPWTEKYWFYPADFFLCLNMLIFTGTRENEGRTLILSLHASPAQELPIKLSNAHTKLQILSQV